VAFIKSLEYLHSCGVYANGWIIINKTLTILKVSCYICSISHLVECGLGYVSCIGFQIREGADKSLARPTFRCRRTESIVSLEREVCSCVKLQVFSCYRGRKEACQRRARIQQHRDASCHHDIFFSCKARRRRKFTPFW